MQITTAIREAAEQYRLNMIRADQQSIDGDTISSGFAYAIKFAQQAEQDRHGHTGEAIAISETILTAAANGDRGTLLDTYRTVGNMFRDGNWYRN